MDSSHDTDGFVPANLYVRAAANQKEIDEQTNSPPDKVISAYRDALISADALGSGMHHMAAVAGNYNTELMPCKPKATDFPEFKCDICGQCYPKASHLGSHKRSHRNSIQSLVSCPHCRQRFSSALVLAEHVQKTHGEKCLSPDGAMTAAFVSHQIASNYSSCPFCKRIFKLNHNLIRHVATYHPGKQLPGEIISNHCNFNAPDVKSPCPEEPVIDLTHLTNEKPVLGHLDRELNIAEPVTVMQPIPNSSTGRKRKHVDLDEEELSELQKIFRNCSVIKNNRVRYNCPLCEKVFFLMMSAVQHVVSKHRECDQFVCSVCDNLFPTLHQVMTHSQNDHFSKGFWVCQQCDMKFNYPSLLKGHLDAHSIKNAQVLSSSNIPHRISRYSKIYKEKFSKSEKNEDRSYVWPTSSLNS